MLKGANLLRSAGDNSDRTNVRRALVARMHSPLRIMAGVFALCGLVLGLYFYSGELGLVLALVFGAIVGCLSRYFVSGRKRWGSDDYNEHVKANRRATELLKAHEDMGQGWFWETDRNGLLTYVSPAIMKLFGKGQREVIGRPIAELFVSDTKGQGGERTLQFHLSTRSSFRDLSVRAATDDRNERWCSITGRPLSDDSKNFLGFRGSGADLTETRRKVQREVQSARCDSLTQLGNRFQLGEWLDAALSVPSDESKGCAVFLLDLDRFKRVNDTFGHPAGDSLLIEAAKRLCKTIATNGKAGRLGGDEFQVILPGHTSRDELAHLASRIIEDVSQPYVIMGHRVSIGLSIGITITPEDGQTTEEINRKADLALYAAKEGGRGQFRFYTDQLLVDARERQQLEDDLREAITQGELQLYYQPQIQVSTERIAGFEALLRWKHPRLGFVSPAKFVPIAEEAGLMPLIGEWVLRTACQDMAAWPENVTVAVNVSALQFFSSALPAIVTSALAAAGVSSNRLELEITESVFLGDSELIEPMFIALKRIGVRLALDDFGTGYSSLSYLQYAPFDKIKIDQSFVRGASHEGNRNGAIIAAIISLAEALGMETTAEGVETLDELDLIRELGCSHVQGYIYAKPLNVTDASLQLQNGVSAIAIGPRHVRATRKSLHCRVQVLHDSQEYDCKVRNLSRGGVMLEGLGHVSQGAALSLQLPNGVVAHGTCRWNDEDRLGVEFDQLLPMGTVGAMAIEQVNLIQGRPKEKALRKVG